MDKEITTVFDSSFKKLKLRSLNPTSWMWALREKIANTPLRYIPIPGTHDSGTSVITADSAIAPEKDLDWLNRLPEKETLFARTTIAHWSKSQSYNVLGQLNMGVRYLDIRVCKTDLEPHFFTCHAMLGESINAVLHQIEQFIQENPHEILLLDFNHFYNMSESDHLYLISKLVHQLSPFLAPNTLDLNAPVKVFWANDYRIILFYRLDKQFNNLHLWNNTSLSSPWPNTDKADMLIDKLNKELNIPRSRFFVTQCVLTPNADNIIQGFLDRKEDSLEKMVIPENPKILTWLEHRLTPTPKHHPILHIPRLNIFITDFLQSADMVMKVVKTILDPILEDDALLKPKKGRNLKIELKFKL